MERTAPAPALTDHAVTRYIQRVIGISVHPDDGSLPHEIVMNMHLQAAFTTREAIAEAVLTNAVRDAIRGGASFISSPIGNIAVRDGTIITIGRSRVEPTYAE